MDYYYKIYKQNNQSYIEITQFKPDVTDVVILPEIDGIPVTDISQRALLSASQIRHFTVHAKNKDFTLARFILRETVQTLRISFILNDGELELAFPGFVSQTLEDTMARAIHTKIEGCGYAYRECIFRDRIDTHSYDALFARAKADDVSVCADIALARLMHPLRLTDDNKKVYEDFIIDNSLEISRHLLTEKDKGRISFFFKNFDIEDDVFNDALQICTSKNLATLTPIIMQSRIL